ncbi:MAG: ABC transporter permease [Cyclobacteriaceae bacterium]
MIKNYLLIALRSFKKNRAYTLLNILGLSIGITCSMIIFLFVYDELNYDRNHKKLSALYRLNSGYHLPNEGGYEEYATGGPIVAEMLVKDFPEIEQAARFRPLRNKIIELPGTNERTYETVVAADSNVFSMFTFPLLQGNPETALVDPFNVVLTETMAKKYFNKTDVLGESLYFPEDSLSFKITGVMADYPKNTHLKMDIMISFETLKSIHFNLNSWWSYSFFNYVELKPGVDVSALNAKIKFISRNYIADQEDGSGYRQEYALMPMGDIHLQSNLRSEIEPNSRAFYVYTFLVIGIFILLIACINFMNLATARSAMRAKEIGLRKVAGAFREQLIGQFLSESVLMALLAMVFSVGLVYLLLPVVNDFTGKSLTLLANPVAGLALLSITLMVGLLAGSYPSFFLSAFRPVETLKGNFRTGNKGNILRKSLVIFQFTISIFLISGTLIVYKHINFLRTLDLGFDKEQIVTIPTRSAANAQRDFNVLKDELERVAGVNGVTLSSQVPGVELGNNVVRIGWSDDAEWSDMRFLAIDENFIKVYGIDLLEGRAFSESFPSDVNEAVMLNESGMRRLGWNSPKEAIGQPLKWQDRKTRVIGVVSDFHFMSANVAIEPFIMVMHKPWSVGYLSAKMTGNPIQIMDQIETVFNNTLADKIFEYSFLDVNFDQQYKAETRFMSVFTFFAGIAIAIACLGLYGLAMYTTEAKFKEIGIRKVLGASIPSLIALLVKEFSILVTVGFVIAIPLAYMGMSKWLDAFPYKEDINPLLFVMAGGISITIALLTVSYQSIKAAVVNPVDSLSDQ